MKRGSAKWKAVAKPFPGHRGLAAGWSPEKKILNGDVRWEKLSQRHDLRHQLLESMPKELRNFDRMRFQGLEIDFFAPRRNPLFPLASEQEQLTSLKEEGLSRVKARFEGPRVSWMCS